MKPDMTKERFEAQHGDDRGATRLPLGQVRRASGPVEPTRPPALIPYTDVGRVGQAT